MDGMASQCLDAFAGVPWLGILNLNHECIIAIPTRRGSGGGTGDDDLASVITAPVEAAEL